MPIQTRVATLLDLPSLVALNHAAYPDLLEEGVVFEEDQLRAHQGVFPEGQRVAVEDGVVVGAIATLILPRAIDPLRAHTWMGVTDGGTFARHEPEGDTLYLADVYVGPQSWGKGVGKALYAELFDLCRRLRLARIVAGGRLYGYSELAETMTPHEYVARVVRGELKDRVLDSQLRAGFAIRGILPNYLHDWRSRHFATLLEWECLESRRPTRHEGASAGEPRPSARRPA